MLKLALPGGGTDLSGILVNNGMRTVQMIGAPDGDWPDDADAVVIALKSRTIPVEQAVAQSLPQGTEMFGLTPEAVAVVVRRALA